MSGLKKYVVHRDAFEFEDEDKYNLSFPCCICIHRHKTDMDEPCRHCDHNMHSVNDNVA